MDVSKTNYVEKTLFLKETMNSWWGKDTDQTICATLLIFAVGWTLCGRPQPGHESMMPLLSLSPLNVLTH